MDTTGPAPNVPPAPPESSGTPPESPAAPQESAAAAPLGVASWWTPSPEDVARPSRPLPLPTSRLADSLYHPDEDSVIDDVADPPPSPPIALPVAPQWRPAVALQPRISFAPQSGPVTGSEPTYGARDFGGGEVGRLGDFGAQTAAFRPPLITPAPPTQRAPSVAAPGVYMPAPILPSYQPATPRSPSPLPRTVGIIAVVGGALLIGALALTALSPKPVASHGSTPAISPTAKPVPTSAVVAPASAPGLPAPVVPQTSGNQPALQPDSPVTQTHEATAPPTPAPTAPPTALPTAPPTAAPTPTPPPPPPPQTSKWTGGITATPACDGGTAGPWACLFQVTPARDGTLTATSALFGPTATDCLTVWHGYFQVDGKVCGVGAVKLTVPVTLATGGYNITFTDNSTPHVQFYFTVTATFP